MRYRLHSCTILNPTQLQFCHISTQIQLFSLVHLSGLLSLYGIFTDHADIAARQSEPVEKYSADVCRQNTRTLVKPQQIQ
jgi:hypothetical protein